jgi:hypothetical protein
MNTKFHSSLKIDCFRCIYELKLNADLFSEWIHNIAVFMGWIYNRLSAVWIELQKYWIRVCMDWIHDMKSFIRTATNLTVRIRTMMTSVGRLYMRLRLTCQRVSAFYLRVRSLVVWCNVTYTGIMFRLAKHVTITHENTRLIAKCIMGFYLALKLIITTIILVYVWITFVCNLANAWRDRFHFMLSVVRSQLIRLRHFLRGAFIFFKKARTILQSFYVFHAKAKLLIRSVFAIYVKTLFTMRYVSLLLVSTAFVTERTVALYRNIRSVYQSVSMLCSRDIMMIVLIWALYLSTSILLEHVYSLYMMTGTLFELCMRSDMQTWRLVSVKVSRATWRVKHRPPMHFRKRR